MYSKKLTTQTSTVPGSTDVAPRVDQHTRTRDFTLKLDCFNNNNANLKTSGIVRWGTQEVRSVAIDAQQATGPRRNHIRATRYPPAPASFVHHQSPDLFEYWGHYSDERVIFKYDQPRLCVRTADVSVVVSWLPGRKSKPPGEPLINQDTISPWSAHCRWQYALKCHITPISVSVTSKRWTPFLFYFFLSSCIIGAEALCIVERFHVPENAYHSYK